MAAIKYKGTDGQWHLMNNILVKGIEVVQTSGDSETYVMSQKAVTESISGHTHSSNEITAMTNYTSAVTSTAISTSDSLNTAIGKLERALDGIKLCQITQAGYNALVAGGTVDSSTLYIITDN